MTDSGAGDRLRLLETEIERRLSERFAALRDEFDRLRTEQDRRWFGFLEKFDQDLKGVVPSELILPSAPSAVPPRPGSVSIDAARGLDQATTQVDVLHRFLDECRRYSSRAALLVSRGGAIGAWKAVGFNSHGGDDDQVRQIAMPLAEGGLLSRVMSGTPIRLPAANEISHLLRATKVSAAIVIPMSVREKISGALYADVVLGEEEIFDPDALGVLTFLAGLVVDRLASRKLRPSPALRLAETAQKPEPAGMWIGDTAAEAEEMSDAEAGAAESGPEAEAEAEAGAHAQAGMGAAAGAAAEMDAASAAAAAAREGYDEGESESAAPSSPSLSPSSESMRAPEAPPREPYRPAPHFREPAASYEEAEPEAARAPEAPPQAVPEATRRLAGPLAAAVGDERHEEARRFARLLVSEIKLYNERAVLEGREKRNLYQRLREDIDRSRQMYDERIPQDVRSQTNFFQEELVRILADGRQDALGM